MTDAKAGKSQLELALYSAVQEKGRDLYRNVTKVSQCLRERGISGTQIRHVELILTDSELPRYLDQIHMGLSAVECNNILISAARTGLSDHTIRVTVEALLGAMGVEQVLKHPERGSAQRGIQLGLYVPPREYKLPLRDMEKKMKNGQELDKEEHSLLAQFVQAGIPMAIRLQGQAYLKFGTTDQVVREGVKQLELAAERGDAEAAALLADYLADSNGRKARKLYTIPGTTALDDVRKESLRQMDQKFRGRILQLVLMACVFLVVQAVIWFLPVSPFSAVDGNARQWCFWISILNCVWIIGRCIQDPYRDLRAEMLPMVLAMFLYAASLY